VSTRRGLSLVVFLIAGTCALNAHDPTAPPVVEIAVRHDTRVTVSMRLPAAALADANLPRGADGRLATDALQLPLATVARGLSQALDLRLGEVPLPSPEIRVATGANGESADIQLSYGAPEAEGPLSARLQQFRAAGERIRTVVRYEPGSRRARTFELSGDYGRLAFEPAVGRTLEDFMVRALDTLLAASMYLLIACALIAPLRPRRTLAAAFATFAAAECVSLAVVGLDFWTVSDTALAISRIFTASAIVVLAALGLLAPRSRWLPALAALSGASFGVDLGQQFSSAAAFAGSHVGAALLVFGVILTLGQGWILALLGAAAGAVYRWRVPEQWGTITLVVVVTHASLHRISESIQPLVDAGVHVDRLLILLAAGWAGAALCIRLVTLLGRKDATTWVDAGSAGAR
jgi:hypothetical protein